MRPTGGTGPSGGTGCPGERLSREGRPGRGDRSHRFRDYAAEFPLMVLLCSSMAYPFVKALDFRLGIPAVIFVNAALLAALSVIFYNRYTKIAAVGLLALLGAAAAAVLLTIETSDFSYELMGGVDRFRYWAGQYLLGNRMYNVFYTQLMGILFSAVICVAVFQFTMIAFDPTVLALCGAGCFVSLFVIGHDIHMPSLYGYILSMSLFLALHNYKRNRRAGIKGALPRLPAYMAASLPLAAVVLIGAIAMNAMVTLDPEWMKEVRDELLTKKNATSNAAARASEGMVVSKGELGGNITLSDAVMMEVSSPVEGVYLRAGSREVYTGHSWERLPSAQPSVFDDTEETREALKLLADDPDAFGRLFPEHRLTVRYRRIVSGLLHVPLKSIKVESESLSGAEIEALAQSTASPDLIYTVDFYHPQYDDEEFAACAEKSRTGIYEDKLSVEAPILPVRMMLDFSHAAREYDKQYTQLPDTLPERVRTLANEITAGMYRDYDKAVAVRDYLKHNFTYTLTPGPTDRRQDFVDQFLFESKRGYCTYFATSMAVLLRCAGVPCRYVEGYVLPPDETDGIYLVTGKQGHAWVEAYFEGMGWLTFDPTTAVSDRPAEGTATPALSPTPRPSSRPTVPPGEEDAEPATQTQDEADPRDFLPPLTLAALALILLALLAAAAFRRLSLRKMPPKAAVLRLFGQYMQWLERQGIGIANGEAVELYAERVEGLFSLPDTLGRGRRRSQPWEDSQSRKDSRSLEGPQPLEGSRPLVGSRPLESAKPFLRAAELYQLARFSEHEITVEQEQQMIDAGLALLAGYKKKPAFLRRFLRRCIWGI